jgi:ferredoxin-type protein NapF
MKKIRVIVSLVFFSLITVYFLDFADLLPVQLHTLEKWQLVPALLSLNVVVLIVLAAVTLLFGRVYCSTLCPMGIFQDIVDWTSKKFQRKKKYPVFKEQPVLRWTIVALTVIAFFTGISILNTFLDPYSAYGRISTNLVKPVYLAGNNLIAYVGSKFDYYRFYKTDIFIYGIAGFITALLTFGTIGYLSYRYGRLYCNTICPVGTVLGFLSRFAIFKIHINESKCNSCGLCSMRCKGSCIDSKTKQIDYSRCVTCFNCLQECNRKAMKFTYQSTPKLKPVPVIEDTAAVKSKRKFLFAILVVGLAGMQKLFASGPDTIKKLKEFYSAHNTPFRKKHPITPPGSGNTRSFNNKCTGCHLCVSKCPSHVLQPTFMEYGIAGMLQPQMSFQHGYCNYHCTVCTEICPSNALEKVTTKEKRNLQIGQVVFIKENCITVTDGTDCGACSEHCPTQAVSMQPYKGNLRIPTILHDLCVGCGGCEYICPVRPFRAIYVEGNPIHLQAKVPEQQEQKKVKLDDFGF